MKLFVSFNFFSIMLDLASLTDAWGKSVLYRIKSLFSAIVLLMLPVVIYADNIKFLAVVIDDITQEPISDVCVGAGFTTDNGPVWEGRFKYEHKKFFSDKNGACEISGSSNCGKAGCYVKNPPVGYYKTQCGIPMRYKNKNLFGVWQPDNLVVTLRLQRVEHPIPLFVKKVTLQNHKEGIGGFDGTNSIVRFDFLKGDWLPPYGRGEVADVEFRSTVKFTDKERKFRYATRRIEDVLFYNLGTVISMCSKEDALSTSVIEKNAGIKIRKAQENLVSSEIVNNRGMRKIINPKFKNEWHCEYYSNFKESNCYQFRIRSKYDDNRNLKEAYYGKIYGNFEIDGDEKKGLTSISFLYYLNPTPLDRNLEWDMKNNLCPNPGSLSAPMP